MGYKMPIVCKEIYLPFKYQEKISFVEYKEKYGIDLHNYLVGDEDMGISLVPQKEFTKIFIVLDASDAGYGKFVEPIAFLLNNSKQVIVINQCDDESGVLASCLYIKYSDGKFDSNEI